MSRDPRIPTTSRRPTRGAGGAWWFARWMLVLVLSFDLVGAPFHQHRHDGVGGQLEIAAGQVAPGRAATNAQSDEHAPASESAVAIRVNPSRIGQLPASDPRDATVAVDSAARPLTALGEPLPALAPPDRSAPDFRSDRSLRPPGRAPPLHA